MLIKALCDYADKQVEQGEKQLPEGWSEQEISFRIMLTSKGEVADIIDVREKETVIDRKGNEKVKLKPIKIQLPERTQKTSIDSNIIEHRPLYIFGLNYENGEFTPKDKTDKAKKSHIAFVKENSDFFEGLDSEICVAYRNFLSRRNPDDEAMKEKLIGIGKEYKGAYFGFSLNGFKGNLEDDIKFREKYQEYFRKKKSENETSAQTAVCGILGKELPISRIHDKITFPGGQSSGCQMVCMKESAFESYGKTQSFNSNVSENAMKKYTSTLNRLLADKKHRIIIDDMVIVYFAIKNNDEAECDFFTSLLSEGSEETQMALEKLFSYASGGATTHFAQSKIDENVTFYIIGMTANSSRICQKFIYRDRFGKLIENLINHQKDLKINAENNRQIFFSRIAKELISPKSSKDKIPPPLMTGIMLSAFNGTAYPTALFETVIRRVKTDSDDDKNHFIKLNDTRAGIIKACINRKYKREEITMSLNTQNTNPAYLCGRLFAVYEKIQQDSSGGGLNRTIKDSYFSSACARPASIMTKLSQLANNHLRKLSEGSAVYYNKLIGEIMNGLDGGFPQTLDLDSQGKFIVGYYQQNKDLYTSKNKD